MHPAGDRTAETLLPTAGVSVAVEGAQVFRPSLLRGLTASEPRATPLPVPPFQCRRCPGGA
jgi:hypothetical protein